MEVSAPNSTEPERSADWRPAWLDLKPWLEEAIEASDQSIVIARAGAVSPLIASELRRLLEYSADAEMFLRESPAAILALGEVSPSPRRLREGQLLADRYVVEEFLGAGGMGEVYRAWDVELSELVALKTLLPEFSNDAERASQLRSELALARTISHPNVCKVLELGLTEDDHGACAFFTMELVNGPTLTAHLRSNALDPSAMNGLAREIAAGLGAAHGVRVVHRDLKSGNILLDANRDGGALSAKLTDFGLARRLSPDGVAATTLIETGRFVGTPAYMAPEQLQGAAPNVAGDIHSLGVILFEICTGRLPFEGDSPIEIAINRIHNAAPSPRKYSSNVPPGWEKAIGACLEANPLDRPRSPEAVIAIIEGRQRGYSRRKTLQAGAFALAGGAAASIAAWKINRDRKGELPPNARESMRLGEMFLRDPMQWSLLSAIDEFKKVTVAAPNHSAAWAGLAEAHAGLNNFGFERLKALELAREEAATAVRLNPSDARSRTVLAYSVSINVERWWTAEPLFAAAYSAIPRDPRVYRWYAGFLGKMGRHREALRVIEEGLRANPDDFLIVQQHVAELFRAGRLAELEAAARELVRRFRDKPMAHLALARALEVTGQYAEAEAECADAENKGYSGQAVCQRATLYAAMGLKDKGLIFARQATRLWRENKIETLQAAAAMIACGDADASLSILHEGVDGGDSSTLGAPTYWYFRDAGNRPEFVRFLKRINFPGRLQQ